jgi:hypothetical protein
MEIGFPCCGRFSTTIGSVEMLAINRGHYSRLKLFSHSKCNCVFHVGGFPANLFPSECFHAFRLEGPTIHKNTTKTVTRTRGTFIFRYSQNARKILIRPDHFISRFCESTLPPGWIPGELFGSTLAPPSVKNTNQPRNNLKFQASLPEADRHDTSAIYRKLTLQELQTIVPQIKWLEYLRSFLDADINEQEPVVAYGLSYFIEMGRILAETDRR